MQHTEYSMLMSGCSHSASAALTWLPMRKVAVLVLPEFRQTRAHSRAVAGPVTVALSDIRTARQGTRDQTHSDNEEHDIGNISTSLLEKVQ